MTLLLELSSVDSDEVVFNGDDPGEGTRRNDATLFQSDEEVGDGSYEGDMVSLFGSAVSLRGFQTDVRRNPTDDEDDRPPFRKRTLEALLDDPS